MRYAIGTFLFCVSVGLFMQAIAMLTDHGTGKGDRLITPARAEHLSNFKEQLALSPDMFDGPTAKVEDGQMNDGVGASLKGGVLVDNPRHVQAVMFLQNLGCQRLRELGGTVQCP